MPEVEWLITEKCNFRCTYCTCATGPHTRPEDVGDILHYIGAVFCAERLNLCGGEPLVSPVLKEVARYCRDHGIYLSMDSNISLPIQRILDILEEGGTFFHYIHTTFHPEFHEFDAFCDKVRAIRGTGRRVDVRLIALHDRWAEMQADYARLQEAGMAPKLKLEKYRRRDYSVRQSAKLVAPYTEEQLGWISAAMGFSVSRLLEEYAYHSFTGTPCYSGVDYVYIDTRGMVYRCGGGDKAKDPLGHVKTLGAPGKTPRPCGYKICPCRESQRLGLFRQTDLASAMAQSSQF